MTRLHRLFDEQGQSPWLDNLKRSWLLSGELAAMVSDGVRGVTANPTIFQRAIAAGRDYDDQIVSLGRSRPAEEAYWELAVADTTAALEVLRPVYDNSGGNDGFVSLELAPSLAHDTAASTEGARRLHQRIARPNLFVKIPATAEGVGAIAAMAAEGRNVNVTLIFGLRRYEEVMEAYLSGLEARQGDLSGVAGVASFFVSRVDTEVDRRLEAVGTDVALALRGRAGVAQAKVAYQRFRRRFAGARWEALVARGARVQRPLWASTSTKNPTYPELLYVEGLIGPDTVNTMPEATIGAFCDHGRVARTLDDGVEEAEATLARLGEVGIDMEDVAATLEDQGVAAFAASYEELVRTLADKARTLAA